MRDHEALSNLSGVESEHVNAVFSSMELKNIKWAKHGSRGLTEPQATIIKNYPKYFGCETVLAKAFNTSRQNVHHIRTEKSWKHLTKVLLDKRN